MRTIAEILKDLLREKGAPGKPMSAYELSELSGVPQPTIQRIIQGKHKDPRISTLKKLAGALHVYTSIFIEDGMTINQIRESSTTYLPASKFDELLNIWNRLMPELQKNYLQLMNAHLQPKRKKPRLDQFSGEGQNDEGDHKSKIPN